MRWSTRDPRPSVLGPQAVGDVHAGHDLHARHQREAGGARQHHPAAKHAVDTESHDDVRFLGFEMDVGCARLNGLGEDPVHQLHHGPFHRTVRLAFERCLPVGGFGDRLDHVRSRHVGEQRVEDLSRTIELVESLADARGSRERHAHGATEGKGEGTFGVQVSWIGTGHVHRLLGTREREHGVAARECLRHFGARRGRRPVHVGEMQVESRGEPCEDLRIREHAPTHGSLPYARAG